MRTTQPRDEPEAKEGVQGAPCQSLIRLTEGEPLPIAEIFVKASRRDHPVYSVSRHGFVIGIGDNRLVRFWHDDQGWTMELLYQRASAARDPRHQHLLREAVRRDGTVVLECVGCSVECD